MEVAKDVECSAVAATGWWNNILEDFQMEALAYLPLYCRERYCQVSDEWNTMFSSSYFIAHKWHDAPIQNQNQWLLLCNVESCDCMSFCFYARTWKYPFSLSNLWKYTCGYSWNPWDLVVKFVGIVTIFCMYPQSSCRWTYT